MASEARGEEAIRGGAEQQQPRQQQVGGGGVGRGAIEWRHQARHRPARPRLRAHLRAAPGRCVVAVVLWPWGASYEVARAEWVGRGAGTA